MTNSQAAVGNKYAFTVRAGGKDWTQAYSQTELRFLSTDAIPEIEGFVIALGLWDNYSVARGMDATAWTAKDRVELMLAAGKLLIVIESSPNLFGSDYWYRLPGQKNRSRATCPVQLSNGDAGLLRAQTPGLLYAKGVRTGVVEDYRDRESFESPGIGTIRVYRKPNQVDWVSKLRSLKAFLKSDAGESVDVRHRYV